MIDRNDVNKNRIYWKRKQKINNERKVITYGGIRTSDPMHTN